MAHALAIARQRSLYRIARTTTRTATQPSVAAFNSPYSPSRLYSTKLADGDLTSVKGRLDLTGRNYVVTGGGRGIGYAAVRAIAESGGNISVLDAAPAPTKDFHNLTSEFGVKTAYIRTDVTDEKSLTAAFAQTADQFGPLHGW